MKQFEIYWSDLSEQAKRKFKDLYHDNIELSPLAIIDIENTPEDTETLNPKEVWETLEQLGLHTHYLSTKAIAFWDEYDKSNYRSLQIKAGKIKRLYGIYSTDVSQQDTQHVTTQPKRFFRTKEEAVAVMNELITQGILEKNEVHILWIYKKIEP